MKSSSSGNICRLVSYGQVLNFCPNLVIKEPFDRANKENVMTDISKVIYNNNVSSDCIDENLCDQYVFIFHRYPCHACLPHLPPFIIKITSLVCVWKESRLGCFFRCMNATEMKDFSSLSIKWDDWATHFFNVYLNILLWDATSTCSSCNCFNYFGYRNELENFCGHFSKRYFTETVDKH